MKRSRYGIVIQVLGAICVLIVLVYIRSITVYYDIDINFMLFEGQRINTIFGTAIVIYSILELEPNFKSYYDISRVVVREE